MSDIQEEFCIRCGKPKSDQSHDSIKPPKGGWHPFRGQDYIDGLEDALLYVRENNRQHEWEGSDITIDTVEPFEEKYCKVCGVINWGGNEGGICFGNSKAEIGIIGARNRRAISHWGNDLLISYDEGVG